MNPRKNHFITLARLSAPACLALGLFLSGCQKDENYGYQPGDEAETTAVTDAELQSLFLSEVYRIPVEQFSEAEIEDLYREITAGVSEAELAEANVQLRGLAEHRETPGGKPLGRAKSGGETIVTGATSNYGGSVTLSGGTLIVGDRSANEVTIYSLQNGTYVVQQVLTPSNGAATEFGKSVSAEGGWLAVGSGTFISGGEVYLYQLEGGGFFGGSGQWVEQEVITTSDQIGFGNDVVLSWPYLAVLGRQAANPVASEITVYKYFAQRWSEQDRLGDGNTFYWDIDMANGWIAANGGQGPVGPLFNPQVFVYQSAGYFSSDWKLTQQLPFPPGQLLLRAVAIDGLNIIANTAIPGNQSSAFRLQGGGWGGSGGSWVNAGTLQHPAPAPFVQTRWVDVEGNTAVVCEPLGDFFPQPGDAVQVYERIDGSWQRTQTYTPADGGMTNYVGVSPIINGNQVYVGAPSLQPGIPGQVYVFD